MKKFELTAEKRVLKAGEILYRIKALRDLPSRSVKQGDLGGFVEAEASLSHLEDCWIGGDAFILKDSRITENALVTDKASIRGKCELSGHVIVKDQARVTDSKLSGHVQVEEHLMVNKSTASGNCLLMGTGYIGSTTLKGTIVVKENATIQYSQLFAERTTLTGSVRVERTEIGSLEAPCSSVLLMGNAYIQECKLHGDNIRIEDDVQLFDIQYAGTDFSACHRVLLRGNIEVGSNVTICELVSIRNGSSVSIKLENTALSGDFSCLR